MNDRQSKILELIFDQGEVSVEELSTHFKISQVTIRKDLNLLQEKNFIKRTHGSAVICNATDIDFRLNIKYKEKLKIALFALTFINEGETIILENSSTNAILARELSKMKNLTIITNSLYICELLKFSNNSLILIGGDLNNSEESFVGYLAEQSLKLLNADKAFLGSCGFRIDFGITSPDEPSILVSKAMCKSSKQVFVLTESAKFYYRSLFSSIPFNMINYIISNEKPSDEFLDVFRENNIKFFSDLK